MKLINVACSKVLEYQFSEVIGENLAPAPRTGLADAFFGELLELRMGMSLKPMSGAEPSEEDDEGDDGSLAEVVLLLSEVSNMALNEGPSSTNLVVSYPGH